MRTKQIVVKISRYSVTIGGNEAIQNEMSLKSGSILDVECITLACVGGEKTAAQ